MGRSISNYYKRCSKILIGAGAVVLMAGCSNQMQPAIVNETETICVKSQPDGNWEQVPMHFCDEQDEENKQ